VTSPVDDDVTRDVDGEVRELHGGERSERIGVEPAGHAAAVDDAPQLRAVGVECDLDRLADRRPGPEHLRIRQGDLGLGMYDLRDDFDGMHESRPLGRRVEHGRPRPRDAHPSAPRDLAHDAVARIGLALADGLRVDHQVEFRDAPAHQALLFVTRH
jgi:hypothetical protein